MTSVTRDQHDRSTIAKVATGTALLGGFAKGWALDRPRIAAALPNARAQGKTAMWMAQLLTGRATNDIVPSTGGTISIAGKVLTKQGWNLAYKGSNALTLGLVGVQMLHGIPNLIDGVQSGDPLLETRAGRTGLIASISGALELGLFGFAAIATRKASGSKMAAMLAHPIHQQPGLVIARMAIGAPIAVNELGFLDFMNTGDERDPFSAARDTLGDYRERFQRFLGTDD